LRIIGGQNPYNSALPLSGAAGDFGCTGQTTYQALGTITQMQLIFAPLANSYYGGVELYAPSPMIIRASLVATNVSVPFSFNGQREALLSSASELVLSDVLGTYVAAGSTWRLNVHKRISAPPQSVAAALASGGALTVGTKYYYVVTNVDCGVESGASSEVSVTPTTGNQAAALTWTAPAYGQVLRIYRGAAAGGETFLDEIPAGASGWTDAGYLLPVPGKTPPAASVLTLDRYLNSSGDSCNLPAAGGNGLDMTTSVSALPIVGGSGYHGTVGATAVIGDDVSNNPSILGRGDSIEQGTGLLFSTCGPGSVGNRNWLSQGLTGFHALNMSIPGSINRQFETGEVPSQDRETITAYADYVVSDLGHNDFASFGLTWQQIAAIDLQIGQQLTLTGKRLVVTTLPPFTASPNGFLTPGGQTVTTLEATRTSLNTWRRSRLVDGTGAPVLSGGMPTPWICDCFDLASAVEVNSSNALTPNGGLWITPAAPSYTASCTGTETLTLINASAAAWPPSYSWSVGLWGSVVKMTSGAAAGQVAFVASSTSPTQLSLYPAGSTSLNGQATPGLSIIPAAGDTFQVLQPATTDGIHPSGWAHDLIAAALKAWAPSHLVPFGASKSS